METKKAMTISWAFGIIAGVSIGVILGGALVVKMLHKEPEVTLTAVTVGAAMDQAQDAAVLTKWKKQHKLAKGEWQRMFHNYQEHKKPEKAELHDWLAEAVQTTPDEMDKRYPPK
jgi:hypothetical protein